jgi:hypothetical protein
MENVRLSFVSAGRRGGGRRGGDWCRPDLAVGFAFEWLFWTRRGRCPGQVELVGPFCPFLMRPEKVLHAVQSATNQASNRMLREEKDVALRTERLLLPTQPQQPTHLLTRLLEVDFVSRRCI